MLVKLYLLKSYSNYFNRKVRKHATLSDYETAVDNNFFVLTNVNFNPNDGITASHVVGSKLNPFNMNWTPDYVLVINPSNNSIISRWFITEFVRNMTEQYTMSLKRDVCADFYQDVISAPTYIEKATLKDDDYFLVNSEGLQFNQIKANEYYLKDKTKCPWLVAYIVQKRDADWTGIEGPYNPSVPSGLPVIEDDPTMRSLFYNETTSSISTAVVRQKLNKITFHYNYELISTVFSNFYSGYDNSPFGSGHGESGKYPGITDCIMKSIILGPIGTMTIDQANSLFNHRNEDEPLLFSNFSSLGYNVKSNENLPLIEVDKLWYSRTTNKVYKVRYIDSDVNPGGLIPSGELTTRYVSRFVDGNTWTIYRDKTQNVLLIETNGTRRNYSLSEIAIGDFTGTIYKDANHCLDVPYDIIAIPFGYLPVYNGSILQFETDLSIALNFMRKLVVEKESNIYDVQLLPYCPIQTGIVQEEKIDIANQSLNGIYSLITDKLDATKKLGIILYSSYSSTTFNIDKLGTSLLTDDTVNVSDILKITNRKIQNECDLFRLVSPNYQGQFDFNVSKSIWPGETSISNFNVDITFRPYNPYIHINPDFGFLYGRDYNDSRGLICGGDFSISSISDAWKQYQINNKNYQNIFDRQISHMEVERAIARERENWGLGQNIAGFLGIGAVAGLTDAAGLMGGLGAIGAGMAGIRSGIGIASSIKEKQWNERSYKENIKYSTDMFNMNLDNIKALPNSLTKVSTLSYNFKFYPVLEYYTCTNAEKDALQNKLKYNGMTVGRIDTISNYLSTTEERFIKGQVIRLDNLSEDSHLANDIYNEINSGVFFMPEGV